MNQTECEYAIITNNDDYNIVTQELSIDPFRCFNKNDPIISRHNSSIFYRQHGLWAIRSKIIISEEIDLSPHFEYFRQLLESKIDIINKFKKDYGFECVFSINIKTEFATGIDIYEEDLSFINKIASRFSCSILEVESLE